MNPDEIDVMKLTPEDYLKMRDRCKELERDNNLQHEHIPLLYMNHCLQHVNLLHLKLYKSYNLQHDCNLN